MLSAFLVSNQSLTRQPSLKGGVKSIRLLTVQVHIYTHRSVHMTQAQGVVKETPRCLVYVAWTALKSLSPLLHYINYCTLYIRTLSQVISRRVLYGW